MQQSAQIKRTVAWMEIATGDRSLAIAEVDKLIEELGWRTGIVCAEFLSLVLGRHMSKNVELWT